ncbi:MAG: glycosyltransferase family 39 protein [Archangium sp.]|nr:glycosyltransferase family 39 protein [Archangium sp.]
MSTDKSVEASESFTEALLGPDVVNAPALKRFRAWPVEFRTTVTAAFLGTLVLVPYLGSVGLWDPWETHYGEVAREMIQRNDYVHPYWENAWFFSKPAFTMWMQAFGMQAASGGAPVALALGALLLGLAWYLWTERSKGGNTLAEFQAALVSLPGGVLLLLGLMGLTQQVPWKLAGVAHGDGALPLFTEWGFRLPFATFSIAALTLLTWALSRTVSPRAGLSAAFVLITMPLYFLESRQAITDIPIISATVAGLSCAIVGLYDTKTTHRSAWWYAAYIFFGVATLAKGLLGFGVPMVVFGLFAALCLLPWTWSALKAHLAWAKLYALVPLMAGVGAGLLAGAIAASLGKSWGTVFMAVPIVNDRPMLEAPAWLGIMWGSLVFWAVVTVMIGRLPALPSKPPALFALMYDMRLGTGILVFLAVCLPWYYEMFTFWRVDDESKIFWFRFLIHDHFARLGSGVHTTTPGGGFTYFIEQGGYAMFPWVALVPGALAVAARLKIRGGTSADGVGVLAVVWFVVTWALMGSSATKFHHYVFPMLPPLAILMGTFIDKLWDEGLDAHSASLLLGVPLLLLVGKDISNNPKNFTDLFVYNYDRPYPSYLVEQAVLGSNNLKTLWGFGFTFVGALLALFAFMRAKSSFFTVGLSAMLLWVLWFNWSHWVDLSHHWTQRDQFWRYYTQRKADEPIASFLMNWRGETFYSRNEVKQIKDNPNVGMALYAQQPGREWALVEHNRLGILKNSVGAERNVTLIDKDLNNKFVLVTIE